MRARKAVKTLPAAERHKPPDWSQILIDAVEKPGVISAAYSQFWNYSVGNQLLALFQCLVRGIEPGPIHTFRGWLKLGRHVKKGERAVTLCMPVPVRPQRREAAPSREGSNGVGDDADRPEVARQSATIFVYRPRWFVLSQTDGADYVPTETPEWSEARALTTLKIARVAFRHTDGNCQGYAREREVAVSPIAFLHHRTLLHEIAHVILGHTAELTEGLVDREERTPASLREAEAECVALICCESLGLCGAEFSRGYVQHWLKREKIPDRSAQRIFKAADTILRAGRPDVPPPSD